MKHFERATYVKEFGNPGILKTQPDESELLLDMIVLNILCAWRDLCSRATPSQGQISLVFGHPRRKRHTGFALMENEHGPCALADDEIALPMAGLGSGVDSLRPFMDGDPIFDRIS